MNWPFRFTTCLMSTRSAWTHSFMYTVFLSSNNVDIIMNTFWHELMDVIRHTVWTQFLQTFYYMMYISPKRVINSLHYNIHVHIHPLVYYFPVEDNHIHKLIKTGQSRTKKLCFKLYLSSMSFLCTIHLKRLIAGKKKKINAVICGKKWRNWPK